MSDERLSELQLGFKAAVRRAVKMAGGGVAAAEETRVDPARLSRYGSAFDALIAPIDVAADLDRAAGDDVILRAWATMRGYELRPRGEAAATEDDLRRLGTDLMRSALSIFAELNKAPSEGKPSTPRLADDLAAGARAITEMDGLVTGADSAPAPPKVAAFARR